MQWIKQIINESQRHYFSIRVLPMIIRLATMTDFDAIWPIFQDIIKAADTYAYQPNMSKEEARNVWMEQPKRTYVFEEGNQVLGTYYIKTNQSGPGSHVCNCGYMVLSSARGNGLGLTMCEHSQRIAKELGYKAMQYNFVASTNDVAVRLWQKLGFQTVGTLPQAFNHPKQGYVDALVMYKWL